MRLRIGHTKLTHGYLMESPHLPSPICQTCHVQITIQHIIEDCPKYAKERDIYFRQKKMKEILEESPNFSIRNLIKFLKDTDLYDKI